MLQFLYILGLFETDKNPLFLDLKEKAEKTGSNCKSIELYENKPFGSSPFSEEVERIQKIINKNKPQVIIAHSLGAYVAAQLNFEGAKLFLDPSFSISEIIRFNVKNKDDKSWYDDGENRVQLSNEFLNALNKSPSVDNVAINLENKDVYIMGAGHGGHKLAERYAKYLPEDHYLFLPQADHNFSSPADREFIWEVLKKRLNLRLNRA